MKIPIFFTVQGGELDELIRNFEQKATEKLEEHKDKDLAVTHFQFFVKGDHFFAVGALLPNLWADRQLATETMKDMNPKINDMLQTYTNFLNQATGSGGCTHDDGFETVSGSLVCKKCKQPLA